MPDNKALAGSFLVLTNAALLHPMLLPNLSEVRNTPYAVDNQVHKSMRAGQCLASVILLAVGLVATGLSDSPIPFWIAVFAAIFMTGAYEYVYRMVS